MYRKKVFAIGLGFLMATAACNGLKILPNPQGRLSVTVSLETPYGVNTKSSNLNSYVFLLMSSLGDTILQTTVGEVNGTVLSLNPDTYTVKVFNHTFVTPAYDTPYYYAQAEAHVISGQSCEVSMVCTQANSGIRIVFTDSFCLNHSEYSLTVVDTVGQLCYPSTPEGRWGYFFPGPATLSLSIGSEETVTSQKVLLPKYMYTFTVDDDGVTGEKVEPVFSVTVDSSFVSLDEPWDRSTLSDGSSKERAYSISEARTAQTDTAQVWITGYVVGQFTSKTNVITSTQEFTDSNVALASQASFLSAADCFPVELGKTTIKESLGLSSNPQMLNKQVWVKGQLTTYYSQAGMKSVTEVVVE